MATSSQMSALAGRLTRHFAACATVAAAVPFLAADDASAAIQYRVYNVVIPANIDGLYINVETGATGSAGSAVAGWDINPYSATSLTWFNATGTGMLRFPGATTGSAGNLAANTPVAAAGSYGSGAVTVGTAAGNWQLNAINLFGFRFVAADGLTHYGWGRMQVGATIATRTLLDIGYEDVAGIAILAGSQGGPPPNYDPCAASNPTASTGANNLPLNQTTAANLDLSASSCAFTVRKANFFKYTPPVSGSYTISTCASGADTRLAVLDGCASSSGVLACNDDTCGLSSSVTLNLVGTVPVYIVVGSATKADLPSPIAVTVTPPPEPACVNATALSFGSNAFDDTGSTSPAVVRSDAAGTTTATINKAMWFKFVPGTTGAYSISLCGATGDTMLAIGDTCPGYAGTFPSIAFNDDACLVAGSTTSNLASFIDATNGGATGTFAGFPLTQDLVAGQTYYIVAGSYSATTNVTGDLVIAGPDQPSGNPADLNGDGVVNAADLAILLGNWGTNGQGDIDGDGSVGAPDLAILLGAWTV